VTIDASKVSMWASIFSIPSLLGWYITGYQTLLSTLQAGPKSSVPSVLMGAFVLFAIVALIANAMAHARMGHLLTDRTPIAAQEASAPTIANYEKAQAAIPESTEQKRPNVKLRAWRPKRDEAATIKLKLWFVFRNDEDRAITVRAPQWRGLSPQGRSSETKCIQTESGRGKADWSIQREFTEAVIHPGFSFRVWIGLDPTIKDSELEKRFDSIDLCRLTLPIRIGDQIESDTPYEV
jgi:hypothetical protein